VILAFAAASFLTQEQSSSRVFVSQGEGVCKQQHSMQTTTPCPSGLDQWDSIPYWEPSPNPTRLWLNLDASTESCLGLAFQGSLKYIAILFCTPLHLATTRVNWCMSLRNKYGTTGRYTPSGGMGCVPPFPTWLWSHMVLGQCELACEHGRLSVSIDSLIELSSDHDCFHRPWYRAT
jgi:hypothetical protein